MPSGIYLSETINVGKSFWLQCPSPKKHFSVVFEDNGETGYFYGMDLSKKMQPILDALHIYNVENVTDKDIPSKCDIVWSDDGLKACLIINNYPHAVFDFESNKAYCRANFPPPDPEFTDSHAWDDAALKLFK